MHDGKMRQGQNPKRSRGRGGGGGGRRNVSPRHQNFDSNGPSIRIRGNASQVYEKYLQLARDANAAGDRINAENMYQHAEHYFRILNVDDGEGNQARNNNNRGNGNESRQPDRQQNGERSQADDTENTEKQADDQARDADSEQPRRDKEPASDAESSDGQNTSRRPARRPRRAPVRAANPDTGNASDTSEGTVAPEPKVEAEVIVEKPVVETAQPEAAEERVID